MKKTKLSVVLAVFNEEKNILRCLKSVRQLADEIVVVDGNSTDKTVSQVEKFIKLKRPALKLQLIKTSNKQMFHINKQMAIDKAKSDWILLIDADEEVNKELQNEIQSLITKHPACISYAESIAGRQTPITNGYWIPRKNIIFNKWIQHTGWWPDYQLRLFKNKKLKFPCKSIHEHPVLKGKAEKLKSPLIHYHYQNISQFLKRLDLYTENDKKIYLKTNKKIKWQDAIVMPINEFIKRFIVWEGYKDGLHGLVLSMLQSFYQFVVFAKVWEEKGFFQKKEVAPDKVKGLIKKKLKEYSWWQKEFKIKRKKGLSKIFLKLIRKLGL